MSELYNINIKEFRDKYDIKNFVETGFYQGTGVSYAIDIGFDEIYSVDIKREYINNGMKKFKEFDNIYLFNNTSVSYLKAILESINGERTLFWLDAHLPAMYNVEHDPNNKAIVTPLKNELLIIKDKIGIEKDVIIMDDARIYIDGPFELGNFPDKHNYIIESADFIYDIFKETHNIELSYKETGIFYLTPKDK